MGFITLNTRLGFGASKLRAKYFWGFRVWGFPDSGCPWDLVFFWGFKRLCWGLMAYRPQGLRLETSG